MPLVLLCTQSAVAGGGCLLQHFPVWPMPRLSLSPTQTVHPPLPPSLPSLAAASPATTPLPPAPAPAYCAPSASSARCPQPRCPRPAARATSAPQRAHASAPPAPSTLTSLAPAPPSASAVRTATTPVDLPANPAARLCGPARCACPCSRPQPHQTHPASLAPLLAWLHLGAPSPPRVPHCYSFPMYMQPRVSLAADCVFHSQKPCL